MTDEFRLAGAAPTIAMLCGFHIRATKPSWLSSEYDVLVSIQHYKDDPGSTVLLPMNMEDHESWEFLWGHLFDTQQTKIAILGQIMPWISGGYHDEGIHCDPFKAAFDSERSRIRRMSPELEAVRKAKEEAIIDQRFDDAFALRDQEQKLQRG